MTDTQLIQLIAGMLTALAVIALTRLVKALANRFLRRRHGTESAR